MSMALMPLTPGAGEIATAAAAAQSMAAVQARYALAVARPRNHDQARTALLADCKRPAFAQVARYSKPVGGQSVEGPSVRFVESALRAYTNIYREVTILYDTDTQRALRVSLTDLETNVTHSTELLVRKTVERKRLRQGQQALSERTNSFGQTVYLVEATEDDLTVKQGAQVSKAIRELGLRILPGDLVDEAQQVCMATKLSKAREDPAAARKALIDAFVSLGIQPDDLAKYLGHPLGQTTPKEMVELRDVYAAIRDGEASWADVIETKEGADDGDDKKKDSKESSDQAPSRTARAAARIRQATAQQDAGASLDEPVA